MIRRQEQAVGRVVVHWHCFRGYAVHHPEPCLHTLRAEHARGRFRKIETLYGPLPTTMRKEDEHFGGGDAQLISGCCPVSWPKMLSVDTISDDVCPSTVGYVWK